MGFAVLLYATYSQWSYVSAPQPSYTEPTPKQQTVENNVESSDNVLGLADALPSIESRAINQETSSATVRTDTLENNVIELYINPSKGADIVGAKLTKYHPSKQQQETPVELLTLDLSLIHI